MFRYHSSLIMVSLASEPEHWKITQSMGTAAMAVRRAGKWSMLVIDALQDGPTRNGALMRRIEGISQKMLTQTLRELEDLRLLSRQDMKSVLPHVEYELTPLGRELHTMVCAMDHRWIEQNMFELIDGSEAIPLMER